MAMDCDFLVIGAGVAGLRAAIELAKSGDVLVVAKDSIRESSSEYAQGGIAVALSDDDETVRMYAALALGRIGPTAVPALITALSDVHMYVRYSTAKVLGQIGPVTVEVVPALMAALQDPDQEVINAAKKALERIQ